MGSLLPLHLHEALAIAPRFAPEFSLLDLGLPVMDGFQLCEQLRKLDSAARVIAVSGYGDHASRARSALAGFEAHLVKPVPIQELLALLAA